MILYHLISFHFIISIYYLLAAFKVADLYENLNFFRVVECLEDVASIAYRSGTEIPFEPAIGNDPTSSIFYLPSSIFLPFLFVSLGYSYHLMILLLLFNIIYIIIILYLYQNHGPKRC